LLLPQDGIKPFYRGSKVTVIGAINLKKVLAVMTINDSMDGSAFAVFIEKFLGSSVLSMLKCYEDSDHSS
jgi:hypothetical protein